MFDRFDVADSPSPIAVRGGALAVGAHVLILSLALRSTHRPVEPGHPVTIPIVYSPPSTRMIAPEGGITVPAPGPITLSIPPLPSFDPGVGRPDPIFPTEPVTGRWSSSFTDSLAPYAADVVDEAPELLSSPPPRYPELLRQAHIEGVVVVEGVVDTLGHLEKGTLRVVSSPHPALSASAEECLARAVFRPGRVEGRAVRVLVQVPVRFSIATH